MIELRSTDILDKEIQEDARKKAEKILKKTDSECENLLSSVEDNIQKIKEERIKNYEEKLISIKKDKESSIPLEKQRFEISFVQSQIIENINKFLSDLSEEKQMEAVFKHFSFCIQQKVNVFVYGFDFENAKKFITKKLGKNLGEITKTDFNRIIIEEDFSLEKNAGFIIEAQDKTFRCRLTLSQIVSEILEKNINELSNALFEKSAWIV